MASNIEIKARSNPKEARCTFRREISMGLAAPIIPYPTGRFFRGRFPRHFAPDYDRWVPPGRSTLRRGKNIPNCLNLAPFRTGTMATELAWSIVLVYVPRALAERYP